MGYHSPAHGKEEHLWGPIKGGKWTQGWQDAKEKQSLFPKGEAVALRGTGDSLEPRSGRWIPRAYSPTASSMKLHPIPGPISSGLRVPSCQVRGRLCPLFCAPPTVAVTYGLMSRGVSWLQGAEEQSAFSSCWKLSLLQSGTQQLLKVAVVEAGETRRSEGWGRMDSHMSCYRSSVSSSWLGLSSEDRASSKQLGPE